MTEARVLWAALCAVMTATDDPLAPLGYRIVSQPDHVWLYRQDRQLRELINGPGRFHLAGAERRRGVLHVTWTLESHVCASELQGCEDRTEEHHTYCTPRECVLDLISSATWHFTPSQGSDRDLGSTQSRSDVRWAGDGVDDSIGHHRLW
jgi:hypothetical protein